MSQMQHVPGGVEQEALAEEKELAEGHRPDKRRKKIATGEGRLAFYLVTPTVILLGVVVGYPIVKAIISSFKKDRGLNPATGFFNQGGGFAGFDNYKTWLLQQCPTPAGGTVKCPPGTLPSEFYNSVGFTVGVTIVAVSIETVIGMIMALMMHKAFKGRGLVRAAVLIPWAIPTAVSALLWQTIYAPNGVANKILTPFGGADIQWSEKWPARIAIVVTDTWKTTPFMALLILAGLQGIPDELYESAKVDGATAWQRFWRITLPLVKPALAVAVIFRSLDTLRMYDLPAILTGGANGTSTLSILVVKEIQVGQNSASALSTITFVFIFACAMLLVKVLGANIMPRPAPKTAAPAEPVEAAR
jgi:ABC-type sugar transport system permease subunit